MQRREALQRANAVRAQRAQVKRDLKEGRCAIDVLLADPPACVQTAAVADLLRALPKYGPVKIDKCSRSAGSHRRKLSAGSRPASATNYVAR